MPTTLIDNSLCVYALRENVNSEYLRRYVDALGRAGVRYVEMDSLSVMKLRSQPLKTGCIFRPIDPMFMRLCEVFDFDYVHLTAADLRKGITTDIPVIFGFMPGENYSHSVFCDARDMLDGNITSVSLSGSFPYLSFEEAARYIMALKNHIPVPINIRPINGRKNALDSALKFTFGGVDSLTLTLGSTDRFCSLEEYFFSLLTVYDKLPDNLNLSALCEASVYQKLIFRNSTDVVTRLMNIADDDVRTLRNADTGERVFLKARPRTADLKRRAYTSALKKMAAMEHIPQDIYEYIDEAIKSYDLRVFDDDLLSGGSYAFLN